LKALNKLELPATNAKVDEISVVLIDDIAIAKLAKTFRNHDHPTDVLAFPCEDEWDEIDGEVIVSLDTASCQAKERNVPLVHELILLVTHGTLHLAGFQDETLLTWNAMRCAEFECLMKIL
tara:strand:- start:254 stop:616 length:363 start_codon:yes stop_codon:yes gene_type:complete